MEETGLSVRKAAAEDLPAILSILTDARRTMRASGNLHQWTNGYPSPEIILSDIERGVGYLCTGPNGTLDGYFAMIPSPEPTYATIYGGQWVEETLPYQVIHRIAARDGAHGIFSTAVRYAMAVDGNIRIDTHADNRIMQHNLARHGFDFCGTIYLANGDPRYAYQKLSPEKRERP